MSCEFYNERKVKHIRKDTRCFGCAKLFPKGRSMWGVSGKFDGDFFSEHLCSPCRDELYRGDYEYGYSYGDLKEGRRERVRDWKLIREKPRCTL